MTQPEELNETFIQNTEEVFNCFVEVLGSARATRQVIDTILKKEDPRTEIRALKQELIFEAVNRQASWLEYPHGPREAVQGFHSSSVQTCDIFNTFKRIEMLWQALRQDDPYSGSDKLKFKVRCTLTNQLVSHF